MNRHHLAHYVIGLAALALAAFGYHSADQRLNVVEHTPPQITGQAAGPWGLLTQTEVNKLSASIKSKAGTKVTVFCVMDCSGIALDFDNAFESAHWVSQIDRPVLDTNTGINVAGPDAKWLADKINEATHNRLHVGVIPGEREAVVISKRPAR